MSSSLAEVLENQKRAIGLASEVGSRLDSGASPQSIVKLLEEQVGIIKEIQKGVSTLGREGNVDEDDFQALKESLKELAGTTETHYQIASRNGIRLSGIGGKPYDFKKRGNPSPDA